jgi:tRNA threonylcarbamoyladenosine biosynthesis protein TsaE
MTNAGIMMGRGKLCRYTEVMISKISTIEDLKRFAHDFAGQLKGGDVIGLVGDLGTGKTTFTQFLAEALGVREEVKSPTFVLVREYATGDEAAARGIANLVHADAYRIEDEDELWAIGFDELASEPDTVTVVEWADKMPALRKYPTYRELRFGFGEGETRSIES